MLLYRGARSCRMLFNSFEFLVFFALFLVLWPLLRARRNSRWAYLTLASFVFYGWWDWRFLFLLVANGLVDYAAALGMARWPGRRKLLLWASIAGNVGALATFKYLDFGLRNVNRALGLFGVDAAVPLAGLALPVGISFYTFQSMSYTIDVYRGQLTPTRNVLHFFAYLSMFPQLVAGPIVRAADLLPQLTTARPTTNRQHWDGLKLILLGYAKKVIIADNLAGAVHAAFASATPAPSGALWWSIMLMFAFQIYCDFSGYSDIARGLAKWMGYEFPLNFNHPYIAASFRDFWTRWHISLSTWFRDYVYIPLGGTRGGRLGNYGNLWVTMVVSGVWHGAAWTMMAWGIVHALYLSVERITQWPRRLASLPGGRHVATLLVFALVVVAWVFFRALGIGQALEILRVMADPTQFNLGLAAEHVRQEHLLLVLVMIARQLWFHLRLDTLAWRWPLRALEPVGLAALLWACVFLRGPGHAFIYFQF